jgi:PAS domain S-box-containing protein
MAETLRVLYVDDEPGLLEIARRFLEETGGFSVVTVESATDALNLLKPEQFEAIISDYQMPVMDGIEFLKTVRASGNTIPFIIFTGKGREEIVIQALNEGADFYIQKGGEPESQFIELAHMVKVAVEQRNAKESYQKSEERFRFIFDSSTDSLYSYDRSGRFSSVNRNLCNSMGLAPDQMIGKTHEELGFPAEQCTEWDKLHQQVYTTNATVIADTSAPMPDGNIHHYNVILNPIHDNRGTIIGISGITRDITELKRAERDLRTSEELLTAMFNGITESALVMSPDGTILAANETVAKRLGQKNGTDLIGQNAIALLPRDLQEAWGKKVAEVLKSGQPVHFEDVRNDRIIDQTLYPVNGPDGTINSLVAFGIDITERKRAEEELKLSEWR